MQQLISRFSDIFAKDTKELGTIPAVQHRINTGNHSPIRQHPRRISPADRTWLRQELDSMLEANIIRPSSSAWASPIVIVNNGKKKRLCVDYRQLNNVTEKDAYPLPHIEDILDNMGPATFFTTLDAYSGYYQVKVHPDDQPKTCLTTFLGNYEYLKMPFGLCNAPATYQRMMDSTLNGIL
jgi:hypothetical protein